MPKILEPSFSHDMVIIINKFNLHMRTINKQKELCEDRIVTWDKIKCSNCDYRNAKRTFLCKSSILKRQDIFVFPEKGF